MSVETQAATPPLPSAKRARRDWPRVIAVVLSVGGTVWAVLLLLAFLRAGVDSMPRVFVVGFLLYLGWLMRATGSMRPLALRRAFWCGSLAYHALMSTTLALSNADEPVLPATWWALVAVLSLLAALREK